MRKLQPGDKCWVQRPLKRHYGVYVGRETFIHNVPNGGVVLVSAEEFSAGQPIVIAQRAALEQQVHVVRRARQLIGRSYDLVSFNCEHVASFAATGKAESPQVRTAMALVASAIGVILLNQNGTVVDNNGYRRNRRGQFASRRW